MYDTMADQVLECDRLMPPEWWRNDYPMSYPKKHLRWLKACIKESTVIRVDNVAEYFFEGTPQEKWDIGIDFPCLSPPFPSMWMEYRMPGCSNNEGKLIQHPGSEKFKMGFLVSVSNWESGIESLKDPEARRESREWLEAQLRLNVSVHREQFERVMLSISAKVGKDGITKAVRGGPVAMASVGMPPWCIDLWTLILKLQLLDTVDNNPDFVARIENRDNQSVNPPKWVTHWYMYLLSPWGVCGPMFSWEIPVAENGSLWHNHSSFGALASPGDKSLTLPEDTALSQRPAVFPCLMALTFMACKNVRITDAVLPVGQPRKEKGASVPQVRYKVLEIAPMINVMKKAAMGEGGSASGSPLHICRGHFKDYRDRGLFGRHKGIYWWDHYVRGDSVNGEVVKEYEF